MAQDTNNNLIVTKLTAPKTWNGGYKTEWKYAPGKSLSKSSNGELYFFKDITDYNSNFIVETDEGNQTTTTPLYITNYVYKTVTLKGIDYAALGTVGNLVKTTWNKSLFENNWKGSFYYIPWPVIGIGGALNTPLVDYDSGDSSIRYITNSNGKESGFAGQLRKFFTALNARYDSTKDRISFDWKYSRPQPPNSQNITTKYKLSTFGKVNGFPVVPIRTDDNRTYSESEWLNYPETLFDNGYLELQVDDPGKIDTSKSMSVKYWVLHQKVVSDEDDLRNLQSYATNEDLANKMSSHAMPLVRREWNIGYGYNSSGYTPVNGTIMSGWAPMDVPIIGVQKKMATPTLSLSNKNLIITCDKYSALDDNIYLEYYIDGAKYTTSISTPLKENTSANYTKAIPLTDEQYYGVHTYKAKIVTNNKVIPLIQYKKGELRDTYSRETIDASYSQFDLIKLCVTRDSDMGELKHSLIKTPTATHNWSKPDELTINISDTNSTVTSWNWVLYNHTANDRKVVKSGYTANKSFAISGLGLYDNPETAFLSVSLMAVYNAPDHYTYRSGVFNTYDDNKVKINNRRLTAPEITNISRPIISSARIEWNNTDEFLPSSYSIYLNGNIVDNDAGSPATINGLTLGANIIGVRADYSNSIFNSDITTTTITLEKLKQPEIYQDASTTSTIKFEDGTTGTYVTKLNFHWDTVANASSYVLMDALTRQAIGSVTGTSASVETASLTLGTHVFYVFVDAGEGNENLDSEYDSSKTISYTKIKYAAPTIVMDNNKSTFTIINNDENNEPDYYFILPLHVSGDTGQFTGEQEYDPEQEAWTASGIAITKESAERGLNFFNLNNVKTKECSYKFVAFAMSFEDFRYAGSAASNMVSYRIIKEPKPYNISLTNEKLLSWQSNAVIQNFHIDIIKDNSSVPVKSVDTTNLQYNFSAVTFDDESFYTFRVYAKGSEIDANPGYLQSDIATYTIGIVGYPYNIVRNKNVITWDDPKNSGNYTLYINKTPGVSTEKYYAAWNKNGFRYLDIDTQYDVDDTTADPVKENETFEGWYQLLTTTSAKLYDLNNTNLKYDTLHKIYICSYRFASSGNIIYSPCVYGCEFTITQLATPEVHWESANSSNLVINASLNANKYTIYIDDTLYKDITTVDDSVIIETITSDSIGEHNITIYAKNTIDPYIYRDSIKTSALIYSVKKLAWDNNICGLKYSADTHTLSWNAANEESLSGYSGYRLTLNGIQYETATNSYTPIRIKYSNITTVQIIDSNRVDTDNPRYLDSDVLPVPPYTFGKLYKPELYMDNNIVKWGYKDEDTQEIVEYSGAAYFEIYTDPSKEPIAITTEPFYELIATEEAIYTIYVKAISGNDDTEDSDISEPITYQFYKIKLLTGETKCRLQYNEISTILSWPELNEWNGAEYFELYINGIMEYKGSNNRYSLSTLLKTGAGDYEIYIIAKSNAVNYLDSDSSYIFKKFIVPSYQYTCKIKGDNATYKINLPFTIKQTASEDLDVGGISFYNSRKDEYQAYTPIDIYIYMNSDLQGSPIEYNMLIEKDVVTEIQKGTSCTYLHNITLIELTKLLQSEFIGGAAITQDLIIIQDQYSPDTMTWVGRNDDYEIGYRWGTFEEDSGPRHYTSTTVKFDTNFTQTEPTFRSLLWQNTKYVLPMIPINDFTKTTIVVAGFGSTAGPTTTIETSRPDKIKYYLIPASKSDNQESYYDMSDEEALAKSIWHREFDTDNKQYYLDTKDIPVGTYNLVYDITGIDCMSDTSTAYSQASGRIYSSGTPHKFRIVYTGIRVTESGADDRGLGIRVDEAVNDLLYKVSPLKLGESPKYELVEASKLNGFICPQYTFSKNKSLWEILLTIGRVFNGIPRLLKGNKIKYDILTDIASSGNIIEESSEPEEMTADMDNYANGFISYVSNMCMDDDNYVSYPSEDGWISPRSVNIMDPTVSKSNMGIVLPSNINYVKELQVCLPNGIYYNVTSRLFEKTAYDALSGDANGQGTAIYYIRGDNRIYGLGQPSENTELAATLGLEKTNYAIRKILNRLYGIDTLGVDPTYLKYRVIYKPLISTRICTEQSNQSSTPNNIYMNFNQDDTSISDTNFGRSSQIQLARIGNVDIKKGYIVKAFNDVYDDRGNIVVHGLHKLGECKVYNGYKYYADIVTTKFCNNHMECTVNYSKDFNKINPRVGVASEYRMWDIPNTDLTERYLNINSYCYISKKKYNDTIIKTMSLNNNQIPNIAVDVHDALNGNPQVRPQKFYLKSYTDNGNGTYSNALIDKKAENSPYGIVVPAIYYKTMNSIGFTAILEDNVAAGTTAKELLKAGSITTGKFKQGDVIYTNSKGVVDAMYISLSNVGIDKLSKNVKDLDRQLPQAAFLDKVVISTNGDPIFSNNYIIKKDRREILGFNYQLHFITYDKDLNLNHSGLTKFLYDSNNNLHNKPLWFGSNADPRLVDKYNTTNRADYIGECSVVFDGKLLKIQPINTAKKYKYMMLVWPGDDTVLFDYYNRDNESKTPELYFNFTDEKLEYNKDR